MDQSQPPAAPPPMAPPPPSQPQWSPPPQQPTGWGGPGYGGPPPRPMGVTLGSIFLIVMGVLISLVGGCATIGGGVLSQAANGTPNAGFAGGIGSFIAGLGIFILVLGIISIVAGAGVLGGRNWARWLGIVISIIFAILLVLGGLGSLTATNGATSGIGTLVVGVLYALTAYALIAASSYFSYRR
jgi:hypothetical protein